MRWRPRDRVVVWPPVMVTRHDDLAACGSAQYAHAHAHAACLCMHATELKNKPIANATRTEGAQQQQQKQQRQQPSTLSTKTTNATVSPPPPTKHAIILPVFALLGVHAINLAFLFGQKSGLRAHSNRLAVDGAWWNRRNRSASVRMRAPG